MMDTIVLDLQIFFYYLDLDMQITRLFVGIDKLGLSLAQNE